MFFTSYGGLVYAFLLRFQLQNMKEFDDVLTEEPRRHVRHNFVWITVVSLLMCQSANNFKLIDTKKAQISTNQQFTF